MALTQQNLLDLAGTVGLTQAQVLAALSDNPGCSDMIRCKRCSTSSGCTECEDCSGAANCVRCRDCVSLVECSDCGYVEHAVRARQCRGGLNSAASYIYECFDLENCHHMILTDGARNTSYLVCGVSMAANKTEFLTIWNALTGGTV